jgi:hypothetical protein
MRLDRMHRYMQVLGDFPVGATGRHTAQDLVGPGKNAELNTPSRNHLSLTVQGGPR